ncbi:zinc finger bed domain-containing protein ricesleeper 2-like [Gigaspora margarita]|uniref:Zinc finger bed domain-containing protein ricesleeper 2-like n=1 Tax=Gigaspora margarita TaxID=4874 RepID=A0A8H3X414_GIGMA|nr:zinc finger bed domain-containing protein ricesleeper 2-like [Gigaspora margarita]
MFSRNSSDIWEHWTDLKNGFAQYNYCEKVIKKLKKFNNLISQHLLLKFIVLNNYSFTLVEELAFQEKNVYATDLWTSKSQKAFIAITGSWISIDWEIKDIILCFKELEGSHSGLNIKEIFIQILNEFNLGDKRIQKLKNSCETNSLPPLNPIIDVVTQWNLTYNMIERVLMIRIAIDKIAGADRGLRDKELTNDDWNFLKLLLYFLEVFKEISIEMESLKHPTLSFVIPLYNSLIDHVED